MEITKMDEIVSVEMRDGSVYITTKMWIFRIWMHHDSLPLIERVRPAPRSEQ
jgi:hypothetical protein